MVVLTFLYFYINTFYITIQYTNVQKFGSVRFIMFLKKSLMLMKTEFIWSKIIAFIWSVEHKYCEIPLFFCYFFF